MSIAELYKPKPATHKQLEQLSRQIDIERIKRDIPIEELIARSFTVTGRGHTLTTEEHDSLKIFTNNNTFTWYSQEGKNGKALGGSVIDWYMHIHGVSTAEAINALWAMLDGGSIPIQPRPKVQDKPKHKEEEWRSPQWQRTAGKALGVAQVALLDEGQFHRRVGPGIFVRTWHYS